MELNQRCLSPSLPVNGEGCPLFGFYAPSWQQAGVGYPLWFRRASEAKYGRHPCPCAALYASPWEDTALWDTARSETRTPTPERPLARAFDPLYPVSVWATIFTGGFAIAREQLLQSLLDGVPETSGMANLPFVRGVLHSAFQSGIDPLALLSHMTYCQLYNCQLSTCIHCQHIACQSLLILSTYAL
jgi:hypothetical protein